MAIGDTSSFSTVLDALWDAIEDVATTQGQNLRDWRKEQRNGSTSVGRNYRTGNIPTDQEQITSDDLPALFVDDSAPALVSTTIQAGVEVFQWPVSLIGYVREDRDTWARMMKARKYAELVQKVLQLHKANNLGNFVTGTSPIHSMTWAGVEFGAAEAAEEGRASFRTDLVFGVTLTT